MDMKRSSIVNSIPVIFKTILDICMEIPAYLYESYAGKLPDHQAVAGQSNREFCRKTFQPPQTILLTF